MRILLVHNFYGSASPSGENLVFKAERAMLEERGHEIDTFVRHSDQILDRGLRGLVRGAFATPWNPFSAKQIQKKIDDFCPDVVHVHNTFPLISSAIFPAAKKAARVLTLHNYRLHCPAGIPMRNGEVCTKCLDRKSAIPSIVHGCYRNSRLATIPLAASVGINRIRGTWNRDVERFIALSNFQKRTLVSSGLPKSKVCVKPNFYPGNPNVISINDREPKVVFVGRLSIEKGVEDLLSAWEMWGEHAPELLIIGDGPLRETLTKRARGSTSVKFLGQVSAERAEREIGEARLLVLPSRWFEGFPMVLREAFAFGTPSIVSNLGPLPGFVSDGQGIAFEAGNAADLLRKVSDVWGDRRRLESMQRSARVAFERFYTKSSNYEILMDIYSQALHERS